MEGRQRDRYSNLILLSPVFSPLAKPTWKLVNKDHRVENRSGEACRTMKHSTFKMLRTYRESNDIPV